MVLKGHKDWILSVAFAPRGGLLASAGREGHVIVWDPGTGVEIHHWKMRDKWEMVCGVAFAPDGRHLALANGNETIYVLRLAPPP
jgi:WD40 repeat protein